MDADPRLTVQAIRTTPIVAPLERPILTASGCVDQAPLILIDLETREGVTGRAYVFAYFTFLLKPLDDLLRALSPLIWGDAVRPQSLEAKLRARFTLLGGARGLAGLALSGIDMAAWDALAIAADLPLADFLGGTRHPIRAYHSVGMIRPDDAGSVAEEVRAAGFTGIKIKIGWPTFDEDLETVRAMRRLLPDACALMVDFNQSLGLVEALRRSRALDGEGVHWIEEPVRCDDFASSAAVARAVETPIQIGENFGSTHEMHTALAAAASDLVMPDAQQIGGVSGWLRAAALAHAAGTPVSSHVFVEVSSHLLAVTPTRDWLELLDLARAVRATPVTLENGHVTAPSVPGTGLTWDREAVERYRVD